MKRAQMTMGAIAFVIAFQAASAQSSDASASLVESGQVTISGEARHFTIHHLPVSSFPELPPAIADALTQRGCTIPQTYQAHRPENVVHASLEHAASSDWAVLCSSRGTASLLVFFDVALNTNSSQASEPHMMTLASIEETARLQTHDASGELGFDWGIDQVTPRELHEAHVAISRSTKAPVAFDHDALGDDVIDQRTIYHYYANHSWSVLAAAE